MLEPMAAIFIRAWSCDRQVLSLLHGSSCGSCIQQRLFPLFLDILCNNKSTVSSVMAKDSGPMSASGLPGRPIYNAHSLCYRHFLHVCRCLRRTPPKSLTDTGLIKGILNEFDRYVLWARNLGAGHRKYELSLDYRLEDASFLRDQVLHCLFSFSPPTASHLFSLSILSSPFPVSFLSTGVLPWLELSPWSLREVFKTWFTGL
jgi:hypothetical protein